MFCFGYPKCHTNSIAYGNGHQPMIALIGKSWRGKPGIIKLGQEVMPLMGILTTIK